MKNLFLTITFLLFTPSVLFPQWEQLDDFQSVTIRSLASNGTKLFVVIEGQGIFLTTDFGNTWTPRNNGLLGYAKIVFRGDTLFSYNGGSLQKMYINDLSWLHIPTPVAPIAFTASDSIYLIEGIDFNVYRSSNYGATWTTNTPPGAPYVLVMGKHGDAFYAGTTTGVRRSTDTGYTWTVAYLGQYLISALLAHSSGFYVNAPLVWRTTDTGNTWVEVDNGLSQANIIYSFASSGEFIFAGSGDNGVYVSSNPAIGWNEKNEGLTPVAIYSLAVAGDYLFAGSSQAGIWRRPLTELTPVEEPGSGDLPQFFELSQNYPNPFNPSTIINYTLPVESFVTIKLYDALGGEVKTLVQNEQNAGSYQVELKAEELISGIYFYRMRAGKFVETRKMILMR